MSEGNLQFFGHICSNISMPDTPSNQKKYPQHKNQSCGCGFPIAKIGVLFSITTGAVIALVIDLFNTHDIQLARKLYDFLKPRDVLLGNRAYECICGFI